MEVFLKALTNAGPGIARFLLIAAIASVIASIVYDRFIRGENGPSVREIAPMLVLIGLIGGALLNKLFSKRSSK